MPMVKAEKIYKLNGKKVTDEQYREAIKKAQLEGRYSSDMIHRKVDKMPNERGVIVGIKTTYNFKTNAKKSTETNL